MVLLVGQRATLRPQAQPLMTGARMGLATQVEALPETMMPNLMAEEAETRRAGLEGCAWALATSHLACFSAVCHSGKKNT